MMTEDQAHEKLKVLKWPDGIPTCPICGSKQSWQVDARKWKCRGKRIDATTGKERWCYYQYTITTQTHLHSRKRSLKHILAACLSFVNGVLGAAALRQRREIKNSYKTPFVFQHRIRAAIDAANQKQLADGPFMEGEVEIDGMFVTGRKVKLKAPITDEKELEKFFETYRETHTALVVVRERRAGGSDVPGRVRTIHVAKEGDSIPFIRRVVKTGTTIHADYSSQYNPLRMFYPMQRVNHSKTYKEGDACTNQAESFFSRVRAAKEGVYRSWRKKYVSWYGVEMAWREENSRIPNGDQVDLVLKALLQLGRSPITGYWQEHKRKPLF
ncbi:IS1595 family transposase [Altererythrobacter sp. KTW20L]|uniref:IS1595 family transposase n=1 Tax=Altererythrobacter sp. KTW20L TaxID=2942210 RepID=UPI0020BFF847|nr:IS1595 family transposase [Altererythrobacter sp. KTW20L]MCL6251066.1 IS1595 family transposase [Altererythrobacter sp. KTW20L]